MRGVAISPLLSLPLLLLGTTAWSQAASLEEIALKAQSVNPQVLKAERIVDKARKDLIGEAALMDSRLSVQGGYGSGQTGSAGSTGGNALSGQASLSAALLEQLSIDGGVTARQGEALQGELSLSINPFAAGRKTYAQKLAYGTALTRLRYLRQRTFFAAEQAALAVVLADQQRELARETYALEQRKHDTVQKKLELGEASFQEMQEQLVRLTEARKNLFDLESRYLSSWKELQLLFDPDAGEVVPSALSLDRLKSLIRQRGSRIAVLSETGPASESLESLEILKLELATLKAELKATPAWRPDLDLSAAVGLPDLSYRVSAGLSFSPNDVKNEEREDLRDSLEEKLLDIRLEEFELRLKMQTLTQNIEIAQAGLEAALLAGQQAALSQREAQLLYDHGERTVLELEQVRLNLKKAQIDSFSAAADLYEAQSSLLMLNIDKL